MPKKPKADLQNPFVIGGIVRGDAFADREREIDRIREVLTERQAKLLVFGPRRMGKTSTLDRAIAGVTAGGGFAARADLSGATTLSDVSTRVMQATASVIGRRWKDAITSFIGKLSFTITLTPDPVTGLSVPSVGVQQRAESLDVQRETLHAVLAAADAFAADRGITLGIVLDEFQMIHRFGGKAAEWHLRGLMQEHQHLSYVAAGSEVSLIQAMLGSGRAFYKLFEVMDFNEIDPSYMGRWIEQRMSVHGVEASGCGAAIVDAAGPRTRDIVQLARATFAEAVPTRAANEDTVRLAFTRIVNEEAEIMRAMWEHLAVAQQNVLRAIAVDIQSLHAADTLRTFGLKSTAEVAQAVKYLMKNQQVAASGDRYQLDSPFFRGWIRQNMLSDVGINAQIF